MALYDLTTLSDVKTWLGRSDSNSDSALAGLISRASRQIYTYLQRGSIMPRTVTELRDGTATQALVLKQWPVTSVSAVVVGTLTIPQAPALSANVQSGAGTGFDGSAGPCAGWACETWDGIPPGRQQTLSLSGYSFGCAYPGAQNRQNVLIVYQAGYQVTNEPQLVNTGTVSVIAPFGAWASDVSVTYANGTPLQKVIGTPAPGQYQLSPTAGSYLFNPSDDGASILVSYGFVPGDLSDACIELVAERYKYSERIGEKSHSLGGNETVSFDNSRLTPLVTALLQPYRRIIPV